MNIWSEFKKFALKGNVVDLATGVIIGGAFGKLVSSLVDNVMSPPLGMLIGGVDFSHLKFVIKPLIGAGEEVSIRYGMFIQDVINFMIVAWALFFMVKLMNKLHLEGQAQQPAPPPPEDVVLLREIRDSLRK